ncbi:diacylglycerol kinase family lipid kinase [Fusibacter bizertensis]|uniref:Diacylglycerol kinase family lipid kinase n=1 Tax=Fusibacter bizertensis TaxID=1488331 RepID=A0ABT6NFI0_9FIRM|nr:diacylglycerol kinase family protein [Fusibacter bizertensis]MDH8679184.1 diacylglycerol kinase family lipid kinase [Fusibacter bizertensis]
MIIENELEKIRNIRKLIFIINPVAGNGKTIEILPEIKSKFDKLIDKIMYKIVVSKCEGDITELALTHYREGYREFVAVGGDGTLSELINAFQFPIKDIPSIGIIPMGTGNDFVKNTDNNSNIENILETIAKDSKILIDIGRVNNFNFINNCSFGIDGPIIEDTNKYKNILPGKSAYLVSTLKAGMQFKASHVEVVADHQVYKGKMILIAVGNGKYFGGGMKICPDAELDDGLLELCMVTNVSKLKFIKEISKIYSGRLNELKEVIYVKSKEIEIKVSDHQYWINADGNLVGKTPAIIKINPKCVYYFA